MFPKQLKLLAFGIKKLSWIPSHWYLSSLGSFPKDTLKFKIISGWNKVESKPLNFQDFSYNFPSLLTTAAGKG